MTQTRYQAPGRMTGLFNALINALTRRGISVYGARVLRVRGRASGQWRTTPVNPLTVDGARYLVAPRGDAQWVRNLRAAGGGELTLGRRTEPFTAIEVADEDKPAVLRAYLAKWRFEVNAFFQGVGPDASDDELLAVAAGYPVFRIA
jgi:deazaflavin-dependent oxidoreductase (nitroreductase family)